MGCGGSKVDGLEAVTLCRGRSERLADAIRHRYALAGAHAAYASSLRSVGDLLHRLLLDGDGDGDGRPLDSPVLHLPTQRKGDPLPVPSPSPSPTISAAPQHSHSRSHSGSHIRFHASDDSGEDDDDDSPLHHQPGPTFTNLHYARGQPPAPSVSFEQRPGSPEAIQFGSVETSSSSYPSYGFPYAAQNPGYSYPYAAQNPGYSYPYAYQSNYGMGGFFGSSYPPATMNPPPPASAAGAGPSSSASKPPPPPPSPPRASAWDFMNLFESNENYYPTYTPSRSSKEVREEEGIPDLEELEKEVVKEAYGDPKFVASTSAAATPDEYFRKMPSSSKTDGIPIYGGHYGSMSVGAAGSSEDDPDVVEKNVAHEERRSMARPPAPHRHGDVSMVVSEIKAQFDRASDSAMELSKLLEVGKHPYRLKNLVHQASSRMKSVMNPPSTSSDRDLLNFEVDLLVTSRSLSSTLQKLYIWEKKLFEEVRAEEKMRLLLDKNCKRLKRLDESGAEAQKIDSTQTLIRKLSTNIRIAILVVDSISNKMSKLRDEELWPQVNELIQGFMRMWKIMLECYRNQHQSISEAKNLDSIASVGKLSDARMDVVMQLELELLRWIGNFSDWITAQKSYVKALNGWLTLCLHYEPEVTADGIPPYSPGRIGAPPVFVICNYWSQAMDKISEREVLDAMQAFAISVRHLWEQHDVKQRQKMMASRDMERWLKTRDREKQAIHKELDAVSKKLMLVPGHNDLPIYAQVAHQGHTAEVTSLQIGLKQIFEAMENFTASCIKAYEELHLHSEEERVARDNVKVP